MDDHLNSGLHLATGNGHTSIVNLLLSSGADANAKNDENLTALDVGASKGYFETCKSLIDHTEISDHQFGNSPLHFAAKEGAHELGIYFLHLEIFSFTFSFSFSFLFFFNFVLLNS